MDSNTIKLFFLYLSGHGLCDYPLQGDFLARGKNHKNPIPGIPWFWCLFFHAMIHSGAVYLISNSLDLAICELIAHLIIDFSKCEGLIGFNTDQILHILCKVIWIWIPIR